MNSALTLRMMSLSSHFLKSHVTIKEALNLSVEQEITSKEITPYLTNVILNRPSALNALNLNMILTLKKKTQEWNNSSSKVVWVAGMGGKAFCAGGDIKTLWDAKQTKDAQKMKILDSFFREEYICDYSMKNMKPFQISAYEGIVMGGGVGISIHSKARIATETSLFAMPEAKIGLFTDVSGSYFLSRLPNNIGLYLGLTGARLKGVELVQAGLANYYIKKDNLTKLKDELCKSLNENSTDKEIIEIIKKYEEKYNNVYPNSLIINELFSGNSLKEIYENLTNSSKYKEFSSNVLKTLNDQCPMSLRVIFEALKRGKYLSLEDCYKMEFRVVERFMEHEDFFEGVRCALVDKKSKPIWSHKSPFDIKDDEIEKYFEKLPEDLELKL